MASGLRVAFASLILGATACGLIYDVDDLSPGEPGAKCGELGQTCCPGNECVKDSVCSQSGADAGTDAGSTSGGVCKPCGYSGEPCCDREPGCLSPLTCASGTCGGCGAQGEACCAGLPIPCAADGECQGGTCIKACGKLGLKCCTGGAACETGSCIGGTCTIETSCGSEGSACCAEDSCNQSDLTCASGTCVKCGGSGQPCCGVSCSQTDLKCTDGACQPCGNEGLPCCDNPQCINTSLTCASGICRTCPAGGAVCGSNPGAVCASVGDGSQCTTCGFLGSLCCAYTGPDTNCPGVNVCCNGSGAGCTLCDSWPCSCKACCVRCGNWAAGNYVSIAAANNDCPTAGVNYCAGKGGKAYAQWQPQCPP
jgi:hypothetical protein